MAEDHASIAKEFWLQAERNAAECLRRADEAVKFYIVATTALAGWLASNGAHDSRGSFLLMSLGVIGAGHVVHFHLRGRRLWRQAEELASALAHIVGAPDMVLPRGAVDKNRPLLSTGNAATDMLFSAFVILALAGIYAGVLAL